MDCYFEALDEHLGGVDIIRSHQVQRPISGATCEPFGTLVLDLTRSSDAIFADIKADVRRMIRKADREGITWEIVDSHDPKERDRLADFYDRCRALKKLPPVSRALFRRLARQDALALSVVRSDDGAVLAANSYVVTRHRARSIYTAAVFRDPDAAEKKGMIARAGRTMWWHDIVHFQKTGVPLFDFGGYYRGDDDEQKLRVSSYKADFGGQPRQEFNCEQAITFRGRVALWALHQLRARQERRRAGEGVPAEALG